jgi:iron(III) transport system substrate-binding protein
MFICPTLSRHRITPLTEARPTRRSRPTSKEHTMPMLRTWLRATLFSTVCGLGLLAGSAQAGQIVVYTASNDEINKDIVAAFDKVHPDIQVSTVDLSTGPITERAIAEKANPQADVIYMVNNVALDQMKAAGVLEPYAPKGSPISDAFRDADGFWVAHDITVMGMAVNTKVLAEKHLPMPTTWEDLINPVYKGQIAIASPTKSGTGMTIFSTLVDMFGWNYVENLNRNIFQYADGGSAPAREAGTGEVAIGLSYDSALIEQTHANPDMKMVIGHLSPAVMEGGGLVAGAKHRKDAEVFLDWLFSRDAAQVFAPLVGATPFPGLGSDDMSKVVLWKMVRPLDTASFTKDWTARFGGH